MNINNIKLTPLLDTLMFEDISDEVYFSKKYSNYISNSRLSLINPEQDGSPDKFFNGTFNNFSDSLIFGSACHQLVLQPESFLLCKDVDRPTGKVGYISDYVYEKFLNGEGIQATILDAIKKFDYYNGNPSPARFSEVLEKCTTYCNCRYEYEKSNNLEKIPIYLDARNREKLVGCMTNLEQNNKIQSLLHPMLGEVGNEKTILLDFKVDIENSDSFILKFKSKLDNYTIVGNELTVNDLKTTGKLVNEFDDAISNYRYYREMAIYCYLLSLCAKKFFNIEESQIKSNFLVVSTIPNYYTKVVPMTKKLFMKGFAEFKNLMKLVAYYVATRYREFGVYE